MNNKNCNAYYKFHFLDGLELFSAKKHVTDFPFHVHDTFNITLILDQVFSTRLADRFLQAPSQSIVITNPVEVHASICENKVGSSFFTFYVSPGVLKSLNGGIPVFFDDKVIYDKALFGQLYFLSQEIDDPKPDFENRLQLLLKKLVTQYGSDALFANRSTALFQRFLAEDPVEKFSLESTAKRFSLDKYKFLRLFKHQTGLTPNNFIILKRIEKCKKLLHTDADLLDIAVETGFYDATHLCKHFKRIIGITPQVYRNA